MEDRETMEERSQSWDSESLCLCSECAYDDDTDDDYLSETDVDTNFVHVNPLLVKGLCHAIEVREDGSVTDNQPNGGAPEVSDKDLVFIPRCPSDDAEIHAIYNSGVKFFDKDTLAYLADIFDAWVAAPSAADAPKAVLKDLLGDEYEISSEVGMDPHIPEPNYPEIER